jgi:hypothetical protein
MITESTCALPMHYPRPGPARNVTRNLINRLSPAERWSKFKMNQLVAQIQHAQSLAADLALLAREESNLIVPSDILNIVAQLSDRISAMLTERRQKSGQIPKDAVITHLLTTNAGESSSD